MIALLLLFLGVANGEIDLCWRRITDPHKPNSFTVARAQVSLAELVDAEYLFEEPSAKGLVIGTGAQGTTYLVSGTFYGFDTGYTLTVAQDATHISKGGDAVDGSITLSYEVQCGINNVDMICTERLGVGVETTTQDLSYTGIIVSTAGATPGSLPQSTVTASSRTTTRSAITTATFPEPTEASGGDLPSSGDVPIPGLGGLPSASSLRYSIPGITLAIPFAVALLSRI
ncbi:uncharacterized protein FOMMEDRAFT_25715 [Fomitiporia mediterranea MF3/22]|uniref:uncharacterized protein n=1 Tax=Fomitiporia mediterranea (strain MF3/22) TaxID=694068 RepID=UPI000440812C|nr:uncharacterized protein FOMMEDRAFT_25715 [Fomitiporia mediterranea MF3/22]EJD06437.1 hypothetical protein FOMMEDRAFT_25715 [Fomitiporia mediterranea MF3/22]